ncbi:glycosyltransferase family 2 protein [Metallosphaera tengchongensis]|uniref:Glycosyltransferase family 2 protein n=1 Tax=Metallosphaera tengchongensis TaxID=1532350 RepID=A0A6N0NZS8_9CREN|nr:glycosyltransferase family 2 protein [Metallosphaera tengchongensis]QKR00570.1 glycosyltransferase family 2 protein [Metallosphaera tengchongensis]
MQEVFLALMALPVLADVLLILQIMKERSFFRYNGNFISSASVIIPIRGSEPLLEKTVGSLKDQDFPGNYEVIFVVDPDQPDLAERLSSMGVKVVLTNYPCSKCSGKIRAQLTGLLESSNDVIVFGDSDTIYPKDWLRTMVGNLDKNMAVTTFSWPVPIRLSLGNLIRAGFWTLGYESQGLGGTFLWGGSMSFRRELFDETVIRELSKEWCDDCTLTRIVKERGGKIAFQAKSIPLNVYDENNLWSWSSRQVITIVKYSRRGAKAFIVIGSFMLILLAIFLLTLNFVFLTPLLLWVLKNFARSRKLGKYSLIPSILSVVGLYYGWLKLLLDFKKRNVVWRDREYTL